MVQIGRAAGAVVLMKWLDKRRDQTAESLALAVREALSRQLGSLGQNPTVLVINRLDIIVNNNSAHGGGATVKVGIKQ